MCTNAFLAILPQFGSGLGGVLAQPSEIQQVERNSYLTSWKASHSKNAEYIDDEVWDIGQGKESFCNPGFGLGTH